MPTRELRCGHFLLRWFFVVVHLFLEFLEDGRVQTLNHFPYGRADFHKHYVSPRRKKVFLLLPYHRNFKFPIKSFT